VKLGGASPRREGGFALAVVILLLFAVGVAGAAAYQVVFLEHRLAGFSDDGERARIIAEAGLNRFFGGAMSGLPPNTDYPVDGGEAQVSSRRVIYLGPWEERYRIHSVGRVTDPRFFDAPAIREVARFGRFRAPPFELMAPFVWAAGGVTNVGGFTVDGSDSAPSAGGAWPCPRQVGWEPEYDLVAGGPITSPSTLNRPMANADAVLAALNAPPWSALTDPSYPVDCEGLPSGCPSPPAGVFPVYRVIGAFDATPLQSGRGVLIVTGNLTLQPGFTWHGIILSGGISSPVDATGMEIRGVLVAGLSTAPASLTLTNGAVRFHSCNVAAAGRSMGVLNPESLSFWSAF
jgi:hypothetical protein